MFLYEKVREVGADFFPAALLAPRRASPRVLGNNG